MTSFSANNRMTAHQTSNSLMKKLPFFLLLILAIGRAYASGYSFSTKQSAGL
jgi:hypothetical protein